VAIAFFDFDRTLIAANSGPLWIRSELKLGNISRWQAVRAGVWFTRYSLGFAAIETAVEAAIATLAGSPEEALKSRTRQFYLDQLQSLYRPGARTALLKHRERGDRLVLLTSSSLYLSELVAEDLHLDGILCNRFEVDERGIYTGRVKGTLCFGEGKRQHAEAFALQSGIPLSECTFYTDSYADFPLMEVVGTPIAVNPDRRLRREALRRGWKVVDWGSPAANLPSGSFASQ